MTVRQGRSVSDALDGTPEVAAAAGRLNRHELGPGEALTAEWAAAGLELPDLAAMRRYRVDRIAAKLVELDYAGIVLFDPLNVRYATDSTNMQLWVAHNAARYAFVSADGYVILWDYMECEFLSGHSAVIDEIRPAVGSTYFLAGQRVLEQARRWSVEMIDVLTEHCGTGVRIAVDQCHRSGYELLAEAGFELGEGTEVMELARSVKSPDEIKAMRCVAYACEASITEMQEHVRPGMTEHEAWAILNAGNLKRAGEWIETRLFASGPRTNPWMQEASSRVIERGDLLAFDTDMVGAYGMMIDISRTWVVDARPSPAQRTLFSMAEDMIAANAELLTPGRTFRALTFEAGSPPVEDYRHYSVLFHGVGQCDEYPTIYFPHVWDDWGHDGVLEPGMVLTSESFVGSRHGVEGVKLENQYLVTETGPELLTRFPVSLA